MKLYGIRKHNNAPTFTLNNLVGFKLNYADAIREAKMRLNKAGSLATDCYQIIELTEDLNFDLHFNSKSKIVVAHVGLYQWLQ